MKKLLVGLIAVVMMASAQASNAADSVTLQLKWVTQAQFAGYYVAQAKGFYNDADLDVTINPGGPDVAPPQVIAGGGADVVIDWMPSALASREKGVALVNIAQPFKTSGMMLTCRKDTGIKTPEDFRGKTLGVWFFGNEYPFLSWMAKLGIPTDGSAGGVTVLKQGFNVDPLLQKQADCVSTMTYNEYWQVIDAGLTPDDLVVFKYEDQGVSTLEDGLYVLEENLSDAAFVDKMARFVAASMKGWEWARNHQQEAAEIVLENDMTGAQTEKHQVRMMGEINKLTAGSNGKLNVADYERTVQTLLSGGSDPVISMAPSGAWTHDVWNKANGM
ncbi:MAG: ABC transporter substrate-binding protein [Rhodospirillales bacterium]|jgi:NitT/TauT family transport system substrate-binding protein|nr:ABC transporter substrate-binding protein [Rhodospirillales bacterium]MBT4627582.1 ABC transporter substrate-binding protein [Rhodospirillales bacterium]MBT5351786.1 ABC transporter substrate-binding protein [Rhodospirillales bacterium]MBT5521652.1 ABC transporter substrate-binding protein [Rhodospirillales bacterium]MBT6110253.1 ABC transporter substrate-binding protein [Rhodospirillales bacterium]